MPKDLWWKELEKKAAGNVRFRTPSNAYATALDEKFNQGMKYAQQGNKYRDNLANSILPGGGMTALKQGDYFNWNWDTAQQAERDRVEVTNRYRSAGIFDAKDYAYHPAYAHLVSTNYLQDRLPALEAEIAAQKKKDDEHAQRNSRRINTWQYWSDMKNRLGEMTENNAPYYWAYADYLLNGDVSAPFDMNAYDAAWSEMDDDTFFADQAAKKQQFESIDWEKVTNKDPEVDDQLYESKVETYEGYYDTVQNELSRRQALENLQQSIRSNADYGTLSAYNDTYEAPERSLFSGNAYEPYIRGYDDLSRFMNVADNWVEKKVAAEHSAKVQGYLNKGYDYISKDELADYNALINAGRTEEAAEYLELLRPELLMRRANVLKAYQTVKAQNPYMAIPTWFDAAILQVENVFNLPFQIYEAATGMDNQYSAAWDAYNKAQWTGGAHLGLIKESELPDWAKAALSYGYKGVSGARDNLARLAAGGFNPTASLIIAGLQSGSGSLYESAGRTDMSGAAKIVKAIGTAAMEVGTEKIGLDALFAGGKDGALTYIRNVMLSEMGEETLNYISEPVLEGVVAFLFDHEAEIMSGQEFWQGLTETAITTAISSLLMGGGGAIARDVDTRKTGKSLQDNGDLEGILKIGEALGENSEAADPVAEIRKKQASGKKVTTRDMGKLVNAVAAGIGEENAKVVTKVLDSAIEERLVELGEDEANAKNLSTVIRKIYRGEKIHKIERKAIDWTDNAEQVVKEMTRMDIGETGESVKNATESPEGMRTGQQWRTKAKTRIEEASIEMRERQNQLQEAMQTKVNKQVEETEKKVKALYKGKPKLKEKEITYVDETGEKHQGTYEKVIKKNGQIMINIRDASNTVKEVAQDAIDNAEEGLGTILEYAASGANHDMSENEINTLVAIYKEKGGDVKAVIRRFDDNYLSGYSGIEAKPSADAPQLDRIAYELGTQDAAKDEEKRLKKVREARRNDAPRVTWLGEFESDANVRGEGTEEALDAEIENLTEGQKLVVEVGKRLSDAARLNVVLFRSIAKSNGEYTTQNGSYDASTHTVYLDVNAGNLTKQDAAKAREEGTLGYAMMRTLGHEVTHALEATSPVYYAKYRNMVKQELKKAGKDWAKLVRGKLDTAITNGEKLTYAGAEAEVVADASEYMLQDSAFVNTLDTDLKGKVQRIIKDFAQKVKAAFRVLTGGSAEARALRDNAGHYDARLQELWDAAFTEMVNRDAYVDAGNENDMIVPNEAGATAENYADGQQVQHSYGGRMSAKADRAMMHEAVEMEFDDVDAKTIRQKTGWFRSMDGQWRYEIDDSRAEYRAVKPTESMRLEDVYDHPDLYEAYPEIADMGIEVSDELPDNTRAGVRGKKILLNARYFLAEDGALNWTEQNKDTLLHEVQHLIQEEEGFAGGSSLGYWTDRLDTPRRNDRLINRIQKQYDTLWNQQTKEVQDLIAERNRKMDELESMGLDGDVEVEMRLFKELYDLKNKIDSMVPGLAQDIDRLNTWMKAAKKTNTIMTPEELYRKTAGEIEARDAAARRTFEPAMRKATEPVVDEDAVFADGAGVMYSQRAQDQMEEDKYYTRAIDKWDGKASGGRMKVGTIKPNSIYTAVGLPDGDLYFDYSKAAAALSKHGDHLTKEMLKQIPSMLASPVVITEPVNQQVQNTVNVFGEMKGNNGKPIMVSIVMRPNRSGSALVDVIRTVEMRQDTDRLITEESVLYLSENKKRTADWFQGLGNLSVPFAGTKSGFIRSISYSGDPVNGDIQKSARAQTETEAFKRWFGNSKVVDEDGKPLVVYHGTEANFNAFDMSKGRANMDIQGAFFSPYIEDAGGYGGNVKAVYLSIQNPANESTAYRALNKFKGQNGAGVKARELLISMGYDGVYNGYDEYIAFYPEQIKSATNNVGTFDPENPDIRYSRRTAEVPDLSIRDMLKEMKPTARMTETEKILLNRYQKDLQALEEKEKQVAEQEEIIRTAPMRTPDGKINDEITKAKNRYRIYRDQANRIARTLADAERNDGFARLMATSQEVVNRFLLGSAGAVGDAADVLDEEIAGLTEQLKAAEAEVTRTAGGQRAAFARGLFDQAQLTDAAQKLKDTYGSRMAAKTIADRLALAYGELYANQEQEGARRFADAAKELAEDLLRGNKYRYKSEALELIGNEIGVISLSDTDVQEIRSAGLTLSEYKRAVRPYIKVVEGGSDLASYASNAAYYGEGALAAVLGDDVEGNLAMRLYDIITEEKAKEQEIGYEGMTGDELIASAMADIAGSELPMTQNSKTVDYLRKELLKYAGESAETAIKIEQAIMNAEAATKRATGVWRAAVKEVDTARKAVEYYRKLEEKRRLTELKEQKQEITEQLKSKYAQQLAEKVEKQRTEYREREQRAREYRHVREDVEKLRRRISRNVKRLNALRMRETDQKHVPQEFQHLADAVMQTFTDSALSRLAFAPEKTASLARRYRMLQGLEHDMSYYWDDEIENDLENLASLGEAYTALRERGGSVPSMYSLEGVELETEILQGVDNIISNVLQMIDSANDAFLRGRTETFEAFATQTGEKIRKKEDYKAYRGAFGKAQKMLDEGIRTGNMTPVYYMEHLDSPELMAVFDEVRKGQSYYAQIVAEGKDFVEQAKAKYHYGAWVGDGKLTMKTSQGHTIELTREEAAELYAIAKREAANKLYQTEHLFVGGFRFKDVSKKGTGKYAMKNDPNALDAADIAKIERWLTDEQKAYADTLVGFLSNQMAEYGNQASMAMYGYKKFTEQYYIPFHTAAEQRFQRGDEGPQGENAGTGRLRNSGFTKKLRHKANATLIVGGLTDTVSEHIHKMATYAAMVEPVENMKRLLNHKVMSPDGTVNTIRALIGQKYGQASQDYMTQLLKDLNGAAMGDERATDLVNKMVGAFKRGAVLASASVVLQQPTAMARAMAYISPKYFAQNPFYRPGKGTWDEMMKHAGTAVIKDMGKFDVGMGLTATQYIADEHMNPMEAYARLKADSKWEAGKAAYKRALDWLTAAPGKADQWTWGLIWKAVKAEQAALHPEMDVTSDAFLDMCGQRFDDVIDHTQVYDSVITRSNLMRSKNAIHKMATSFMSEPVLSLNMLWDALTGKHSGKQRAAIIGSVVASQVLAGAFAALAQAWNDDDDKRNVVERYADRATGNILDNLNPLGMIPYVSDIMSMFAGYEVERPDMAAVKDIIDYAGNFFEKAADPDKNLTWKDYENFVGSLANMVGLPAKNISREIRRTRNLILNSQWEAPSGFGVGQAMLENVPGYDVKNAAYYERIVAAELDGDVQKAEDYREYMLLSKMVSEDALKTGLKKAMQERFIAGDADEDTAKQYLLKIGAETEEDEAYWEVDKWKDMRDKGIAAGDYRKYDDFFQAVETGENLKATIKEYLDNGVSKTTLASQITSQYKQQLIEAKKSGKGYADLQARILTAYEALGYDRQKKLKDIQKWLEEAK